MLLPLVGRNLAYDLVGPLTGPDNAPVVAFSHSLAADLGMWAEQVPALVAAGYRVLRMDLRGHGGSGAPPGPYTSTSSRTTSSSCSTPSASNNATSSASRSAA